MLAEFLYYTSCLPKAGTELDLSAGSGRAQVSLTREAITRGLLKRDQGEPGDHSGYTDHRTRSFQAAGRHDGHPWLVSLGRAISLGRGQWGSQGSPVVCLAMFLAVSPPFLPLLPAQRFYELPKNLLNNSFSSFSLILARAFCCS